LQIERILLTHGHFDHVGAVQSLCDELALTADVHDGDRLLLRQAQLYSIRWAKTLVPIPKRVRLFAGNPTWEWAGGVVETIETAGHTAGSVTYCIADMAFTGDTIFYEKVGPTFYPGGDRDALLGSIDRLLTTLRPSVTLFPGHGRPWSAAAAQAWWRDAGPSPETFDVYAEQGESPGGESQGVRDV
jgi:glyoxylase-like metal-dependent hydrolase (beta-lactamase superfamily II)